jgi:hypothetical protein
MPIYPWLLWDLHVNSVHSKRDPIFKVLQLNATSDEEIWRALKIGKCSVKNWSCNCRQNDSYFNLHPPTIFTTLLTTLSLCPLPLPTPASVWYRWQGPHTYDNGHRSKSHPLTWILSMCKQLHGSMRSARLYSCGRSPQSMGFLPCPSSNSLQREKWPHPRNPRCADSGDGCVDMSKWCRFCAQQTLEPLQLHNRYFTTHLKT